MSRKGKKKIQVDASAFLVCVGGMQIYFLSDHELSAIPFGAFELEGGFLMEKVAVGQSSSLHGLRFEIDEWGDDRDSRPWKLEVE